MQSFDTFLVILFITCWILLFFKGIQRHGANTLHLIQSVHQMLSNVRVIGVVMWAGY